MKVEIVTNPEELEAGDIIIYSTNANLKVAKLMKKPGRRKDYPQYFASTRCMIPVVEKTRTVSIYKPGQGVVSEQQVYSEHVFDMTAFNKIKYISLYEGRQVLKVIE